ncbi:MAG: serine hydrolase domain-containing protein, partial [Bacteroidota bacterium]
MKLIHKIIYAVILLLFQLAQSFGQEPEKSSIPRTIPELKSAIEKVLEETQTPAVGLALVRGDSAVWITGLGKANLENDVAANENTMFRIGSISKMYVSLAILKLQQEGQVSLKEKVRDLVPEIEFENPWEETSPILVEHLLEHTTGWDDIHLTE